MLFCHMTLKVNPVTLTLYSSPDRAIPQPSGRSPINPHTEGVSNHMGNSLFAFSLTYSQKWSTMYSLSSTAERESLPSVFQERLR